MKLVNLNCPSCSGELDINEEKRIATCKYCGTRWYIEDENYTRLSRLEQRVDNLERTVQEERMRPRTSANRTVTSGTSGNVPPMPAPRSSRSEPQSGDNAVSLILVFLMMIGFGYVSSLDHSGSSPVLGAFVSGICMTVFSLGVYIKFHRNPGNIKFGITFLWMFIVYFFLALL